MHEIHAVSGMSDVVLRDVAGTSTTARAWRQPVLVALFGLPCAGKTEVARALAAQLPLARLATDELRLRYAFASGPVTRAVVREVAAKLLDRGQSVVWDGVPMGRDDRKAVAALARDHAAQPVLVYATARPDVLAERLSWRLAHPLATEADGKFVITREHFDRIASYLDEPASDENIFAVDTSSGDLSVALAPLLRFLGAGLV